MARYINCKKCIHYKVCVGYTSEQAMEETTKAINGENCLPCEEYLPTADVAPKSEVDKWFRECEELQGRLIELKKEVAREIFEEVESICLKHIDRYDRYIMCCEEFAELKKKYTEDTNDA